MSIISYIDNVNTSEKVCPYYSLEVRLLLSERFVDSNLPFASSFSIIICYVLLPSVLIKSII